MPRRVHHLETQRAEGHLLTVVELFLRILRLIERNAEHRGNFRGALEERSVEGVHEHRHGPPLAQAADPADVIDVPVRQPDRLQRRRGLLDETYEDTRFGSGVNHHRSHRRIVDDEVGVLQERANVSRLDPHAVYPPAPVMTASGVPSFSNFRYFSAATAAVVASPTAVVTWRVSCERRSPAAKRPRILVCMF